MKLGTRDRSSTTLHSNPPLSGWAGVEDHMLAYDNDRVQGYTDDIDTLLVFAGLFSSILSAFVVQTYQLLQDDAMHTTNQLIAFAMTSYFGAANIQAGSPAVDTIIGTLLSPMSSTPGAAARWINGFFFISMALSLAAALFGIRAKQWLRKYMQWNSPLGSPRENILVRQIRIEAWENWNVDVTIAFIPALLELAIILFLAGITILLWTLDGIVAKTVTAVVGAFAIATSGFTVLPIFFRRCPYKSPIAWAVESASRTITSPIAYVGRLLQISRTRFVEHWEAVSKSPTLMQSFTVQGIASHLTSFLQQLRAACVGALSFSEDPRTPLAWPTRASSWREQDLDSCHVTTLPSIRYWTPSRDARTAAKLELAREATPLNEHGEFAEQPGRIRVNSQIADTLLTDISQSAFLLRALSWVQMESQDTRVRRYLHDCITSLHPDRSLELSTDSNGWFSSYVVADFCLVSALFNGTLHKPQLAIAPSADDDFGHISGLRKSLGVSVMSGSGNPVLSLDTRTPFWVGGVEGSDILMLLLCADFGHVVSELSSSSPNIHEQSIISRRILELVSFLDQAMDHQPLTNLSPSFYVALQTVIRDVLRFGLEQSSSFNAICVAVLRLAFKSAKVIGSSDGEIVISHGKTDRTDYEGVLSRCFSRHIHECNENQLDMYVLTTTQCFIKAANETSTTIQGILENMVDAVAINSVRHRYRIRPSGADDRCWIYALSTERYSLSEKHGPIFRRLLHSFERHYRDRALVGDQMSIRRYLHTGLQTAHSNSERCEDSECLWTTHTCGAARPYGLPDACDLLPVYHG